MGQQLCWELIQNWKTLLVAYTEPEEESKFVDIRVLQTLSQTLGAVAIAYHDIRMVSTILQPLRFLLLRKLDNLFKSRVLR